MVYTKKKIDNNEDENERREGFRVIHMQKKEKKLAPTLMCV